MRYLSTLSLLIIGLGVYAQELSAPRIECVVALPQQSHEKGAETIWYDDFNADAWKPYKEKAGTLDNSQSYGEDGKSLQCFYAKSKQGKGGTKLFFGDSAYGGAQIVKKGQQFREIYFRVYVRHQDGWHGGTPAKLARATSIVASNWSQGMIAHVWQGKTNCLTLDPVRCVDGKTILTKKYNDWGGLKWLGNSPSGQFPICSTEESGVWYAVEMRTKLNTPGKSDGENDLWIDGKLETQRRGLNFMGSYTKHTINAVFLESYWNKGAPADLYRWYDNFVVSTKPIGLIEAPANPTIIRAVRPWEKSDQVWQCEIAKGSDGKNVVFTSKELNEDRFTVSSKHGKFTSKTRKLSSGTFYCRARQQDKGGSWSEWSTWHQGFVVP